MLARFFRLFVLVMVFAGVAILFAYAFVAALILTPILLLLFFLFGRRARVNWLVVHPGQQPQRPGEGPVIDHDPNDLPHDGSKDKLP